jgi:SAM-dependent methyltransferase
MRDVKSVILSGLARFISSPEIRGLGADSPELLLAHRQVLERKAFLRQYYRELYREFCRQAQAVEGLPGELLEIGSGPGFLKDLLPEVITSDVCAAPWVDRVVSAGEIPFEAGSLKGIFLMNVLHHLANPTAFFQEARRCLIREGRVVMIEPFNSLWAKVFYSGLHQEPFEPEVSGWEAEGRGRLDDANAALPWIIFWRDRGLFEQRFPDLPIESIRCHTVFSYLGSGGLSWQVSAPAWSFPGFWAVDRVLSRFRPLFPIFQTVVLKKA